MKKIRKEDQEKPRHVAHKMGRNEQRAASTTHDLYCIGVNHALDDKGKDGMGAGALQSYQYHEMPHP